MLRSKCLHRQRIASGFSLSKLHLQGRSRPTTFVERYAFPRVHSPCINTYGAQHRHSPAVSRLRVHRRSPAPNFCPIRARPPLLCSHRFPPSARRPPPSTSALTANRRGALGSLAPGEHRRHLLRAPQPPGAGPR